MNADSDYRLNRLKQWLNSLFHGEDYELSVASSDASFRRYFRVRQHDSSWIVMDAPPEHEDVSSFVAIAEFMSRFDVHVPKIFAKNADEGYLLLTDLGNTSYLSVLTEQTADTLYRTAIDEIIKMQMAQDTVLNLPAYDEQLLRTEMALFPDWFLARHLSLSPPSWLDQVYAVLIENAVSQPQFFVHRDYHSRNLMLQHNDSIGVIDFQDAVHGPVTYDLVSLLRDCYIRWPQARIDDWLQYYLLQAEQHQLLEQCSFQQLQRWFDLMGLQRHLKVLGIFCRLNYRDGKAGYMNDLPLTLHYVIEISKRYPEMQNLHQFLTQTPEIMAIQ